MSFSVIAGEQPEVGNSLLTFLSRWRDLKMEATGITALLETEGGHLEVWAALRSEGS